MSSSDDAQERTEDATPKRQEEAREKGHIVRSKELSAFALLICTSSMMIMLTDQLVNDFYLFFKEGMNIQGYSIDDHGFLLRRLYFAFVESIKSISIVFILTVLVSICSSLLVGGFSFYPSSIVPKWERIDPLKGLQRIFSIKGITELFKSLLKFIILVSALFAALFYYKRKILILPSLDVHKAIFSSFDIVGFSFFMMISFTVVVVFFDISVQLSEHAKQTKMTKQEIKEEYKETEGKPEVKSKIRKMQNKIARMRMMAKVPKADFVLTNPTHYAVALQYDKETMNAPIVVAKGVDFMAEQIKKIAKGHDVPLVSLPALARSLYHTTELEEAIPGGLYVAVAQVLAYVYQLQRYERGQGNQPLDLTEVPIPPDLEH